MTKEEAKEYVDNYISHIIQMVEYGNWFSATIKGLVEDAKDDCDKIINSHKCVTTKKSCNDLKKEIDSILNNLRYDLDSLIINEVNKLTEQEQEWLEENVSGPFGLNLNYSDKASKLLLLIPIATAGMVADYGKTLSNRIKDIYNQEIMSSYVSGIPFDELDYEPRFNTFFRGLEVESKTLGSSLSEQYDRIIFTSNDNKITGYIWQSLLDINTCLVCGDLSGKIFNKIEDVPLYPAHLNCVTEDTLISTSSPISRIYRRFYEGNIYRIETASGNVLSITPNHPVLTTRGFISAKFINVGDNIIINDGYKLINIIGENKYNTVTSAKQLFSSYRESSSVISTSMELTSEDFHNDISNKKINIINTNGCLGNKVDILTFKKIGKSIFVDGIARFLVKKFSHCNLFLFFRRQNSSFRSDISSPCNIFSLFLSRIFHSFNLLFSTISFRNIVFLKKMFHLISCKSKFFSNSANANSFIIKVENFFKRNICNSSCSISLNSSFLKDVINTRNTDIELSCNILCRNSTLIKTDNVIRIEIINYSGHVYNLETVDNFYYANNLIVHNCRCSVIPINNEIKDCIPETYSEWFENQPQSEKRKILGKTRFQLYEQGMKIKNFVNNNKITPLKDLKK